MIYNSQTAHEEFTRTGESWLLERLSTLDTIHTIFDVGSNCGEWTRMARYFFSAADIHTFEIVPEVYKKLINNNLLDPGIIPNSFGLSNKIGTVPMKYCAAYDSVSTHLKMLSPGSMPNMEFEWRDCLAITGDFYMQSRAVPQVDILKIDVEGAEGLVLDGFIESMSAAKIGLIQFEYGTANIVARWLLVDAYEKLEPLGFKLGKLTNGLVNFRPFDLTLENFVGPNIVAVHQTRCDIFNALT
jgi:FkbM family methyltransferase